MWRLCLFPEQTQLILTPPVIHDEVLSWQCQSAGRLNKVMTTPMSTGEIDEMSHFTPYVNGSENIWNFPSCVWLESSLQTVGRLLLITVSARAEGPWPDLLNAWLFQFPLLLQDLHINCSVFWITKFLSRETFQWQRFLISL